MYAVEGFGLEDFGLSKPNGFFKFRERLRLLEAHLANMSQV
jgi:hypothetical protein